MKKTQKEKINSFSNGLYCLASSIRSAKTKNDIDYLKNRVSILLEDFSQIEKNEVMKKDLQDLSRWIYEDLKKQGFYN